MIERLSIPLDEREILPVVFRVATRTFLARSGGDVVRRMKSTVRLQAAGDFGMAFQAFEGGLTAELVTAGAIRRSIQGLMRPRQRPGRDLGKARAAQDEPAKEQ